jgi:hypothetical protein
MGKALGFKDTPSILLRIFAQVSSSSHLKNWHATFVYMLEYSIQFNKIRRWRSP